MSDGKRMEVSCKTIEALSNEDVLSETKRRMIMEMRQLFFTTPPKERADVMRTMYAIKKSNTLSNDGYAKANTQIGEFMRVVMSGNYNALKEHVLSKNQRVFGDDEMGLSIFAWAAQSGLSVIDYLNQIYGTSVTADTKLTKSDGTEISFSDALTNLIAEEWITGARKKIAELRANCPESTQTREITEALPEIHELPFKGLNTSTVTVTEGNGTTSTITLPTTEF